MKVEILTLGLVAFLLSVTVQPSMAQSSSSANDEALNAVATLLGVNPVNSLPSCVPFSSKGKKFCPVVSQCPADKPLCLSVFSSKGKKSKKIKMTCACSDGTTSAQSIGSSGIKGSVVLKYLGCATNGCPYVDTHPGIIKVQIWKRENIDPSQESWAYSLNNSSPGYPYTIPIQTIQTDKDGHFNVSLPAGVYLLYVSRISRPDSPNVPRKETYQWEGGVQIRVYEGQYANTLLMPNLNIAIF